MRCLCGLGRARGGLALPGIRLPLCTGCAGPGLPPCACPSVGTLPLLPPIRDHQPAPDALSIPALAPTTTKCLHQARAILMPPCPRLVPSSLGALQPVFIGWVASQTHATGPQRPARSRPRGYPYPRACSTAEAVDPAVLLRPPPPSQQLARRRTPASHGAPPLPRAARHAGRHLRLWEPSGAVPSCLASLRLQRAAPLPINTMRQRAQARQALPMVAVWGCSKAASITSRWPKLVVTTHTWRTQAAAAARHALGSEGTLVSGPGACSARAQRQRPCQCFGCSQGGYSGG